MALGNLDTSRDFGYAGDYVEAMWRMLQQDEPSDFVVATGTRWSIRQVLDLAFYAIGIEDWSHYVVSDERFLRPAEVDQLVGDASRARERPGVGAEGDVPRGPARRWSATTSSWSRPRPVSGSDGGHGLALSGSAARLNGPHRRDRSNAVPLVRQRAR